MISETRGDFVGIGKSPHWRVSHCLIRTYQPERSEASAALEKKS